MLPDTRKLGRDGIFCREQTYSSLSKPNNPKISTLFKAVFSLTLNIYMLSHFTMKMEVARSSSIEVCYFTVTRTSDLKQEY
jgi:DNA-binding phage protein